MNFGRTLRPLAYAAITFGFQATLGTAHLQGAAGTDADRPANRRNYDALAARAARRAALAVPRLQPDPALLKPGAPVHVQSAMGVPSFLWAAPGDAATGAAGKSALTAAGPEEAARAILARFAPAYGLDADAASRAVLREIHSTGRGGVVARFGEEADGIEVFRNEIRILMSKDLAPIALAGYLTGHRPAGRFALGPAEAIAAAARDFTGGSADAALFRDTGRRQGAYAYYEASGRAALAGGSRLPEPTRVKQVWFDLPDGLVPGYYVELDVLTPPHTHDLFSYVISAADGAVLFRNDLTADASFSYRVWAETSGAFRPFDGPQGTDPTPHVALDGYQAPFLPPNLVTLASSPFSKGDPWLPAGATETTGNNVEAYVDLFTPDGFSAGDFHATATAPGQFDYTHDLTLAPNFVPPSGARTQQMAVITQLFYDLNFFHDWYYDSGFDEKAGNAQNSNYGRGGVEGDSIRAEAQDFSGRNNANMATPADGGRPRMQMYLFDGLADKKVTVTVTPASGSLPLGDYAPVGTAVFGPTSFTTPAEIAWASANGSHDGCAGTNVNGAGGVTSVPGSLTGKIVFIDRGGSCTGGFAQKYQNAVLAGAAGVIIGNISTSASPGSPPNMAGTPTGATTIGILSLNFAMAQQFRAAFPAGTVQGTIVRPVPGLDRDGSLDPQIQAHEWGHYISNRLIGNASGLVANQSRGLGEGWADFHAMLLTVRAEDVGVTGNDQWQAPYALGGYTTPAFSAPSNPYYYGIRRFPYSTDMTKNPLTYRHIANGQTITGAPINLIIDDGSGTNNAEVHNTGEVWAEMLWECYAALLRDVTNNTSGRGLTFAQAQQKMKDILVAAYKMTPNDPTLLEARDALLAAAYADDVFDYQYFAAAFAKRGAGALAVATDRYTPVNIGGAEDYTPPIGLALAGTPAVGDDVTSVCADGVLQVGETGTMTVVLRNLLPGASPATTGTLTSSSAGVTISNPSLSFSAAPQGGLTIATTQVGLTGAASGTSFSFSLSLTNALAGAPVVVAFSIRANYVVGTSATDDVESPHSAWTTPLSTPTWKRVESTPFLGTSHRWFGPDAGTFTDVSLTSPVLQVGGGTFSFTFQHRWQFEFSSTGPTFFDGGVVEISTDNGATWADVGAANLLTSGVAGYFGSITSGSNSIFAGTLATGGLNALQGRNAFEGISPLFPTFLTTTVNLGTAFANKAVRIRFRIGTDVSGASTGWEIDNIAFSGIVNQPFDSLVAFTGSCPSSVTPPTALAGPNQSVLQNAPVTLDGTGSTTPNGGTLTYTWVQVGGPSVVLSTPTSSKPTFTAPAVAPTSTTVSTTVVLTFMLTVNDGTATSAPSYVTVTVTNPNRIPVANAGAPQTVTANVLVTLNGSGTDADGNALTYAWTQTGGPAVTLSSTTVATPTFTAPNVAAQTVFTFQLVVNDGQVSSAASSTTVTVNPAPCLISSVVIVAPAAVCAGSTGNVASIPAAGGPPYQWQILSGGTITSGSTSPSITFTANATGPVVISVSVGSAACVFTNQVNVPVTALPSATITAPASVVASSTGNIASVPDAGPGATYSWSISGGTIELTGSFTRTVTFTAGASGTVVLSVTVTQNGCSASSSSPSIPITASPTGRLALVPPCRVLDTRGASGALGGPALAANATRVFPVSTSSCGIPASASALAVNYTVTNTAAAGSLSADAGNVVPGIPTVISFRSGQTRANNGFLRLATDGSGTVAVTNNAPGTVDLILDVVGYFQ